MRDYLIALVTHLVNNPTRPTPREVSIFSDTGFPDLPAPQAIQMEMDTDRNRKRIASPDEGNPQHLKKDARLAGACGTVWDLKQTKPKINFNLDKPSDEDVVYLKTDDKDPTKITTKNFCSEKGTSFIDGGKFLDIDKKSNFSPLNLEGCRRVFFGDSNLAKLSTITIGKEDIFICMRGAKLLDALAFLDHYVSVEDFQQPLQLFLFVGYNNQNDDISKLGATLKRLHVVAKRFSRYVFFQLICTPEHISPESATNIQNLNKLVRKECPTFSFLPVQEPEMDIDDPSHYHFSEHFMITLLENANREANSLN
jgi:hypothetical protein